MINNQYPPTSAWRHPAVWLLWAVLIGATFMTMIACAPKPAIIPPALSRLPVSDYPFLEDRDSYRQLHQSITMSLDYLRKLPPDRPVHFGPDTFTAAHLVRSLETFRAIIAADPPPEALNRLVREHFRVYRAAGATATGQVLFTGYYEPVLPGSLKPQSPFTVPVHPRPKDLLEIDLSAFATDLRDRRIVGRYNGHTVVPYPERREIVQEPDFDRIAPPLAWVSDEIDLFMMMVQGSGRIVLNDGAVLHLQFDGSNGRPYRSIGRLLIDMGIIDPDDMSMQAIRDYLRQNPEQVRPVLDHNPRYIFFRSISQGPLGALGVPLTPMRSLAVDRQLFPLGALAFITLPLPQTDEIGVIRQWMPYRGFALSQDTGSAIKGSGRADLFFGTGLPAEGAAGHLRHNGELYFLILDDYPDPFG